MIVLAGLPGTGKSSLATALAACLPSAVVLNKDAIRAAMFPDAAAEYSAEQNGLAMTALFAAAGYLLSKKSRPAYVLIDGRTFSRAVHIAEVVHLAQTCGADLSILHLWCPDEVAFRRLEASQDQHPAGNRDRRLYMSLKQSFEPILQPHLVVNTSLPLEESVKAALVYLGV